VNKKYNQLKLRTTVVYRYGRKGRGVIGLVVDFPSSHKTVYSKLV